MKSKGLGDSIEKFTTKTGIKSVVDKISEMTGVPCGCEERRDLLNKWIPYTQPHELNDIVENNADFRAGTYILNVNIIINKLNKSYNYNKGDKIFLNEENELFSDFEQYYKLGLILWV